MKTKAPLHVKATPSTTPLPPGLAVDQARAALLSAVLNLDDEGFNAIAWMIYQQAKTAGGFKDREGWLRVRTAAERLPFIAEEQRKFDTAYSRADEHPPTVVKGTDE
jgi:hypothetical protein